MQQQRPVSVIRVRLRAHISVSVSARVRVRVRVRGRVRVRVRVSSPRCSPLGCSRLLPYRLLAIAPIIGALPITLTHPNRHSPQRQSCTPHPQFSHCTPQLLVHTPNPPCHRQLSRTHRAHHENLGRVSSRVRVGSCSTNYLMYNKIGHGMP